MQKEWFYGAEYDVKAYIIDSHRPLYHMSVMDESQKIIVINDGCKSFQECPTLEDYHIYQELNRIGDEEGDDLDDEEEQGDSSDDEAGMENRGMINDEEEADQINGAAQ